MRNLSNISTTLESISKKKFFLQIFGTIAVLLLLNFNLNSQIIFQESFSSPNGTTSGSSLGVNWSSTCPTCLSGDYWEVRSGVFEARDTNGEAEWITDNSIDISNCSFIEVSFNIQSVGTMEACGTGCNSADFVVFQYNIDAAGWTNPSNSTFCGGTCAGVNVVASDDVGSITYSTGCIPANGNGLRLRIAAQCWAADEYWRIDNVTVTCSSPNAGTNGNLSICSSGNPTNLLNQLGGNPANGGVWSGPSNLTGGDLGTFDPTTMSPGTYTYTVGTAPCQATADVVVSLSNTNAGTNGTMSINCGPTTDDLFPYIGGNPTPGGVWTGPSPIPSNDPDGNFDPMTMLAGVYTYTVGTAPCQQSSTVTVTIVNNNNAGSNNSINLCSNGTPINFLNVLGGTPDNGGTWSGPSSLTGGDLGTFNPSTMNAGTYTYTVGSAPCENSSSVTVSISPFDDASFTANNYCEGTSNSIVVTGLSGGTFSFNPLPTNGATINPSTGAITNGIGGTTYSVQYTTNGACPQSSIQTIDVYQLPNVQTSNQNICLGGSVTISASGASTYTWNNGLGNGPNHFVSPTSTTTYIVTGTNNNGCQSSNQSVVTVNPIPNINAGPDQVVCEGDAVSLYGSGGNTYSWTNGVSNGIPFYPTNNSTYTVTGIDANGCQNTDSVIIAIESKPIPSFYSNNVVGCAPFTTSFINSTIGNYSNCEWSINGNTLNNCDSVSYTFNNSGLYGITLTLESSNGCIGATAYPNYIYVQDNPVADFSFSQIETTDINTEVSFHNGSTGAVNYTWSFGDGSQSTAFEPVHAYDFSANSSYLVSLVAISDNGCQDSTQLTIENPETLIYYVPNSFTPDGNEFNNTFSPVFTEGFDPFSYHLSIYNRWGELIFESKNPEIGWDGTSKNSMQMNDIYIWKIDFKLNNSGERVSKTGHVNLLK